MLSSVNDMKPKFNESNIPKNQYSLKINKDKVNATTKESQAT